MIDYDRHDWHRSTFAFAGTVLPRVLGRVGLLTGFCLLLCLLNDYVLGQFGYPLPALDQLGHVVLGSTLGLLIVIRTNAANNRYWEGRSHWGMLVNTTRNLARLAEVYAGPADDLARLLTAYVVAVKETLRGNRDLDALRKLLPGRVFTRITAAHNPPSVLARSLSEWIQYRLTEGRIDSIQAMTMERLVANLLDQQGGCEKIHKTPLPFVFAALLKQLLLLYLFSLPFVLVAKMDFAAPLVVAVVAVSMLGIEEAGVEIEDPFAREANDLPLDALCETIRRDVTDLTERTGP